MKASPQVVVITGASAGIGRATAWAFAKRGARIGLIARDKSRLEATAREVQALGGQALVLPADVADHSAIDRAASRVEEVFGPIDVWVNNAMVSVFSRVRDMRPREYRRVTDVTYLGVVYGTLAALKRMSQRGSNGRGCIVQVGSALAYRSIPLQSAYCAAKHAMLGFTNSLRSELIEQASEIHLTTVHLPAVNTPQFHWVKSRLPQAAQPVPPIFQPEVAADAIVYASQHHRREVLVGWPTVKAVWGNKFFPGWLDQYLARNAIDGQQTDEPADSERQHNLWKPVAGKYSAHGDFDDRASSRSTQWLLNKHRGTLAAMLCAAVVMGLGAVLSTKQHKATPQRKLAGAVH